MHQPHSRSFPSHAVLPDRSHRPIKQISIKAQVTIIIARDAQLSDSRRYLSSILSSLLVLNLIHLSLDLHLTILSTNHVVGVLRSLLELLGHFLPLRLRLLRRLRRCLLAILLLSTVVGSYISSADHH
jgi:hypothetical protein